MYIFIVWIKIQIWIDEIKSSCVWTSSHSLQTTVLQSIALYHQGPIMNDLFHWSCISIWEYAQCSTSITIVTVWIMTSHYISVASCKSFSMWCHFPLFMLLNGFYSNSQYILQKSSYPMSLNEASFVYFLLKS